MNLSKSEQLELDTLLEAVCEERLTAKEGVRLEQWLTESAAARKRYRQYITLHGILYWDTAIGLDSTELPVFRLEPRPAAPANKPAAEESRGRRLARWSLTATALVAMGLAVALLVTQGTGWPNASPAPGDHLADRDASSHPVEDLVSQNPESSRPRGPVDIAPPPHRTGDAPPSVASTDGDPTVRDADSALPTVGSSDETIRALIARELSERWAEREVVPSPPADDLEWMRRVYLDLVGHIPPVYEAERFASDSNPRKREQLVDDLLDRSEFVQNWSSVWANLMVGRAPERSEYRQQLLKFLRDSFRQNRPWNEVVAEIVSAEGTLSENGAGGFLLAHVNNQAVPATAITAKLFLGTDVQCTQCHDHPTNDEKQNQFWELNSFFKQTARRIDRTTDPRTGTVTTEVSLVTRKDAEGPAFFENRHGLVRAAFPIFDGVEIDPGPETNRRRELGRLMSRGEKPQIAEAFVNRLWAHFLGYGFTNPVDDMGTHNAPSHPELLDRLAREFVLAGYDQKRLMKWICLSDAYARSSRMSEGNADDNPELGETPLFSRVYVKPMSAEQVYNSLLVATGVVHSLKGDWNQVERQQSQWLQQFVHVYDNDENDEVTHFTGTIPQALMLMNGDLIRRALDAGQPNFFRSVVTEVSTSDEEKIRQLCLSALTREPTERELASFRKMLANRSRSVPSAQRKEVLTQGMQDVFWAYLNSSEFVAVH
jgi:hypothetical protein